MCQQPNGLIGQRTNKTLSVTEAVFLSLAWLQNLASYPRLRHQRQHVRIVDPCIALAEATIQTARVIRVTGRIVQRIDMPRPRRETPEVSCWCEHGVHHLIS